MEREPVRTEPWVSILLMLTRSSTASFNRSFFALLCSPFTRTLGSRGELPTKTAGACHQELRALMRTVVLGTTSVIVVSLAVPAFLIQEEYRKLSSAPSTPAAEVVRERTAGPVAVTPDAPAAAPDISEISRIAEQLVRRNVVERRAAAGPPVPRRPAEPALDVAADAARAVSTVLPTPPSHSQRAESP